MGKTILLLGLGMQGRAALYDLVKHGTASGIIVADTREDLEPHIRCYPSGAVKGCLVDASDEGSLRRLMEGVDLIVDALPGSLAFRVGRLASERGVSLVSSMYYLNPEVQDPKEVASQEAQLARLDEMAKRKEISILTEFGLDPGIDLILGARAVSEMDTVRAFYSYGAGIPAPEAVLNPLKYKFSWSVPGVMRSYRRPARIMSRGRIRDIDGTELFEEGNYHTLELEETGIRLECYPNGDSIRYARLLGIQDTIAGTGRYTCRLPGHCALWRTIVQCGFLENQPLTIGGASFSPMDFTASVLGSQERFRYAERERDIAFIRIDARGERKGRKVRIVYQLLDQRDLKTGFTAMQRTTGFTLSLGARLLLGGALAKRGLLTALDVPYELVIPSLEEHGLRVSRREVPWE